MSSLDCCSCGACCATFRVSFYWAEAAIRGLPSDLVEQLTPWHACLSGTNAAAPRCMALRGDIGKRVRCTVYDRRPSPCREFQAGDDRCAEARHAHRLPAMSAAPAVESPSSRPGAAVP